MRKNLSLLAVGLIFVQLSAFSQVIIYDIFLAGRDVGELKITPARTHSYSESLRVEGSINTLFYDVIYVGENHFENGTLKTSMSSQEVNGKLKEKTNTIQNQNKYQVIFADPKSASRAPSQILHPINHTITSLYYREPVNMKEVYSDRFGKMCPVHKLSTGSYKVEMPDGKNSVYTYSGGRCQEVRSEIVGFELVFKIRPDGLRQ